MKYENIVGNRYGRLVVLEEERQIRCGRPRYYVKCQCDCGTLTTVEKSKVKNGDTSSCGCLQTESRKALGSRFMKENGEAAFHETFMSYKKSAKKRGYSFSLTEEEFRNIITQPCIYCGDVLTSTKRKSGANGEFKYTGIDRYDNSIGYEIGNCVPCCSVCNRLKTDMSVSDMEDKMEKILSRKSIWKRTA